jgi:hypothetical protein
MATEPASLIPSMKGVSGGLFDEHGLFTNLLLG